MAAQEDYGWEEVYRAYGCSPLYQDDGLDEAFAHKPQEGLLEDPPAILVELEPLEETPQKVPLLAK